MRITHYLLLAAVGLVWGGLIFLPLSISSRPVDDSSRSVEDELEAAYAPFDSLQTDVDDYIWPTDASHTMTSGFADFRATHFHGGIDISTRGVKGFKVFAVRDGYVARIRVSPFGYGKMLYVRHADGYYTTYAHLQRFNDRLEEYVRAMQLERQSYPVDVSPSAEQFPVEKGEVIAYTGDTGVGPPHLHFEIRDANLNPVNPLLLPAIAGHVTDDIPPSFEKIAFTPLTHESTVQSDFQPWIEGVRQLRSNDHLLHRVMHLKGLIGISVRAFDRVNASWHSNGVYGYDLYIDSVLAYSSRLNRVPDAHTKQVSLHYDWSLWYDGKGRFQKSYVDLGNRLPFYDRGPEGTGIIDTRGLGEGFHELRIVARDMKGNQSHLRASFVVSHTPQFELKQAERKLYVTPAAESAIHALTIASKRQGSSKWNIQKVITSSLASTDDGFEIPLDRRGDVFKIVAETEHGSKSYPQFYFAHPSSASNTSLSITKEFYRDYLYLAISSHLPLTLRPSVWISTGDRRVLVDINSLDVNKYVGTVPLALFERGIARIEAEADVNGTTVTAYDEFSIFPISPSAGGTVMAGDGEFTLTFPPNGVYQPLYCRVEKNDFGYSVYPKDILLNRGATIEYRPATAGVHGKSGLYGNFDGSWDLLKPSDPENPYLLTARVTRFLGDFAVLTDVFGPTISDINARYSGKRLSLRFRLYDNLSGVDSESLRVLLNDQFIIPEYDPYNRRVTFDERVNLPSGLHHITIEVSDKIGNRSFTQKSFRVQ